jgi:hypothetical protein
MGWASDWNAGEPILSRNRNKFHLECRRWLWRASARAVRSRFRVSFSSGESVSKENSRARMPTPTAHIRGVCASKTRKSFPRVRRPLNLYSCFPIEWEKVAWFEGTQFLTRTVRSAGDLGRASGVSRPAGFPLGRRSNRYLLRASDQNEWSDIFKIWASCHYFSRSWRLARRGGRNEFWGSPCDLLFAF